MNPETRKAGRPVSRFSALLSAAKLVFTPVAIGFLIYLAWQSRSQLAEILANAEPRFLFLSFVLWLLMSLAAPVYAIVVFRGLGHEIKFADAARIHIVNLPARYLPGGIWHTVGRVMHYRGVGIGSRELAVFVFLENTLSVTTAFILGGSLLIAFRGLQEWGGLVSIAVVASTCTLALVPMLLRIRARGNRLSVAPHLYLASVFTAALAWCIAASAFVAFVNSFPTLMIDASNLDIAGTYLVSWGIGFLAIFAPQGVGVFEVAAAELLRSSAALASIVPLFAMFRLVILAADLFAWLSLRVGGLIRESLR